MKRKRFSRREFLAQTGAAALTVAAGEPAARAMVRTSTGETRSARELPDLRTAFLNPPHDAKPMTRWWWFGGAVTPEEITRELEMMRDAGMRGVELQPVYPVAVDDAKRGIRNTRYFSPEWFDLMRHTLRETRRLGLQFDLTLGSGWPYGGPFIPGGLAAHKITVISRDTQGPGEFTWPLFPYMTGGGRIFSVVASPALDSGEVDISRSVVIPLELRRGAAIQWTAPQGRWRIFAFVDDLTAQMVKRPTIGMEGYVIDHFNRRALELFLDAIGNRTDRELNAIADPPFTSVFCDSLEVFGADWTPRLLEEFKARRGYDLTPLLPALWEEAGEMTAAVRYDYHLTLSDLIIGDLFKPLQAWSGKHGMTARVQAHGAMGDVMQGYGAADIPEGEEGVFADRYSVIIDHRRLASSAAHIYGKPVVSCESYTWLRQPRFLVTLEQMKGATDSSFLDGINQIVNQGYSYSPPQAGEPGWVFYASTMVNHNNIWWPHYKHLTAYIQRAAAVLLHGMTVNPVAVYVPLADIFSHYGLGSLTIDTEIERRIGLELFTSLRQAGYDFDLINDDALARIASVQDGKLKAGTGEYSVVIVPGAEFMPPESLDRLAEFARSGGYLIFTERLPQSAPGVPDRAIGSARLQARLTEIFPQGHPTVDSVQAVGNGKAGLSADRASALKYVQAALGADFKIVSAAGGDGPALQHAIENVGFAHRRVDGADVYFISNVSALPQDLRIQFRAGHKRPERWNPEDGSIEETLAFSYAVTPSGGVTEVGVYLRPFESCFIVFGNSASPDVRTTNLLGPLQVERAGDRVTVSGIAAANGAYAAIGANGKKRRISVAEMPDPVAIEGPWQLALDGVAPFTVRALQSWTEFPAGKSYSGWGTYDATFHIERLLPNIEWEIDLGSVHETAEVTLNGTDLGAAWKGWRRLPCRHALEPGKNRLTVRVGNLWIQKVVSLPPPDLKPVAETFGIRWGLYGESRVREIPPSGLLGPVRLLPSTRVRIEL
ncbi:MAG: glycosyl hydrolase [Terriglobia bacterium]